MNKLILAGAILGFIYVVARLLIIEFFDTH